MGNHINVRLCQDCGKYCGGNWLENVLLNVHDLKNVRVYRHCTVRLRCGARKECPKRGCVILRSAGPVQQGSSS